VRPLVLANPVILLPSVWNYLDAYSGEKTADPYRLFDGQYSLQKPHVELAILGLAGAFLPAVLGELRFRLQWLGTFLIGLFVSLPAGWRQPGHTFVLFMLFFLARPVFAGPAPNGCAIPFRYCHSCIWARQSAR